MDNNKKSFTLIELLVVIAIIGLLSTVVLISLQGVRAKARDARRIQDLNHLKTALEAYYNDHNAYPITNGAWKGHCNDGANWIPGLDSNYMPNLPENPTGCSATACVGGFKGYIYKSNATGSEYKLLVDGCMETDNYTAVGKLFDDPVRNSVCGAIYTDGASEW